MVQEADRLAGVGDHDNGWRRRTFRVLQEDGTEHTPDLSQVTAEEESRIVEFYDNLFDSIPPPNEETSDHLRERFDSSRNLLKGITLERVFSYASERYAREASRLLSGDPLMDFRTQLEATFYWSRLKEIAEFVPEDAD